MEATQKNPTTPRVLRILIVEDDPRHREDAVAAVSQAGHAAVCASTYGNANYAIDKVDAVLSDVHFPYSNTLDRESGQDYTEPTACGLAVAMLCEKRGLPFVLCTDGHHHGNKAQWVFDFCGVAGWDIVEGRLSRVELPEPSAEVNLYTDSLAKSWDYALLVLLAKMSA